MNCKKAEKLMQNLTLVVFKKSENSRDTGGKSESYIIFHYCICEFLAFFLRFVLLKSE